MLHRTGRSSRVYVMAAAMGLAVAGIAGGTATASTSTSGGNAVNRWNENAGKAALAACIAPLDNPLHESRMYAMMHIAVHDALNAIDRRSTPYAYDSRANERTSRDAVVAAAARDVLVSAISQIPAPFPQSCRDAGAAQVELDYAAALDAIPDGRSKSRGIDLGRAAAAAVVHLRSDDGSDALLVDDAYPQGTAPGEYRFTPGTPFAFAPGWGNVTPFALDQADQFRPGPPAALGSARYTRDFRQVKQLGGDGVTTPSARTAQQTETALFWVESSPLAWNRIARGIATDRGLDLWQSARLFGLLNLALADGYVASFDTKYDDKFWRPVTAIQLADTDGNARTAADPTWTPLRTTPPIPDHDSAHSVQGGAAAAVMKEFFGTDRVTFTACSRTLPTGSTCTDATPVTRRYTALSQAAAENAFSRVLVGFHFLTATEAGNTHGKRIGQYTAHQYLRPVS